MSNQGVREAYKGREHSLVEHKVKVLERYLMRLLMLVGQYRADTPGYVDCFAGPWESEAEDLTDTSIDIALRQMKEAHDWFADHDRFRPLRRWRATGSRRRSRR